MAKKVKAKILNMLELTPRRLVEWSIVDTGERKGLVNVSMPKFRTFVGKHFCDALNRPRDITVRLDRYGTFVWLKCDGRTRVKDIGTQLEGEFGKDVGPVHGRLAMFLRTLEGQRLITFIEVEDSKRRTRDGGVGEGKAGARKGKGERKGRPRNIKKDEKKRG